MLENFNKKNLKTITQKEFDEMVNEYEKWIKKEFKDDRKPIKYFSIFKLNLSYYNLSNLKIKNKDLPYIVAYNCLLNNVSFEDCNLEYADIRCSKFKNTNFINCNLSYGDFLCDEFINTDLSTCDIKKCNFNNSSFGNTTMPDYPMTCPEKGNFIGYKIVCDINNYRKKYILKLEIPKDAKRSSATSNKCRCDKAKVLEIQNLDGSIAENITKVKSLYTSDFIYKLGETVEEPKFDECRWYECAPGIHFFMNREEAVNYIAF